MSQRPDLLSTFLSYKAQWNDSDRKLAERLCHHLKQREGWTPFPGPQTQALESQADETFYGGAGGGGKSALAVGLALTRHRQTAIFRRTYGELDELMQLLRKHSNNTVRLAEQAGRCVTADGRRIRLCHLLHEKDKENYRGRPNDLIVFDEAPRFTESQVSFVMGWNRTTIPGQRCRVLLTGNPPARAEERWIIAAYAPWLDDKFSDPAEPGELRWYVRLPDNKLIWRKSGEPVQIRNALGQMETVTPRSRTFIPARLQDNPVLSSDGKYLSVLQGLREPLRSQVLYGDMNAGTDDDAWQVIPTAWIRAAQARWTEQRPAACPMDCIGVDVAQGGAAQTVLAPRYGHWLAPLVCLPGRETPEGQHIVRAIQEQLARVPLQQRPRVTIHYDCIGVGAALRTAATLLDLPGMIPVNFGASCSLSDETKLMRFLNWRAYGYWHVRDLLDPERPLAPGEERVALPPDNELLADLAAPRYAPTPGGIKIEPKDDISERLGRSPDKGDAVVNALLPVTSGKGGFSLVR